MLNAYLIISSFLGRGNNLSKRAITSRENQKSSARIEQSNNYVAVKFFFPLKSLLLLLAHSLLLKTNCHMNI